MSTALPWLLLLLVCISAAIIVWLQGARVDNLQHDLDSSREVRRLGQNRQDRLAEELASARREVEALRERVHAFEDTVVVSNQVVVDRKLLMHSPDATAVLRLTSSKAVDGVVDYLHRRIIVDRWTDQALDQDVFRARLMLKDLIEEEARRD